MLKNFTFSNCLSFRDEFTFNMEKSNGDEYEQINTFETSHGELLKSAVIFGGNASGKTNFIKALHYMKSMAMYSVLPFDVTKDIEPFKFIEGNKNEPIRFEIDIIINDTEYLYGFEILKRDINKEWLKKKNQRFTFLFERTSSDFKDIKLFGSFKDEKKILEKVSSKTLFIGIAAMFNNKIAKEILDWFDNLTILSNGNKKNINYTIEYLEENPSARGTILKYLKAADIDIEDFNFEVKSENQIDLELPKNHNEFFTNNVKVVKKQISEFNTKHKVYDKEGNVLDEFIELPFDKYQSAGTKKFFAILGPILKTIDNGGILVIDEIDSMLHCAIVRLIWRMFNSLDININNAQLICNTHDVLLLDEDIRRDQIWFIQKNDVSESEMYCLNDFTDIRKSDNLLKKYLLGMFGAIPFKRGEI